VLRRRLVLVPLAGLLIVGVVATSTDPTTHGHWTDPGTRLVDGLWVGPAIACQPEQADCAAVAIGAREALAFWEQGQVAQIQWVTLPSQFVTDVGEPRSANTSWGILSRVAAIVTFDDGHERSVGLQCYFAGEHIVPGSDPAPCVLPPCGRLPVEGGCARPAIPAPGHAPRIGRALAGFGAASAVGARQPSRARSSQACSARPIAAPVAAATRAGMISTSIVAAPMGSGGRWTLGWGTPAIQAPR
jgi:hypothetical protein